MPKYIVYILWDRLASAHTVLTRLVFAILVFALLVFALFVFAHLVFAHFCFRPFVFALFVFALKYSPFRHGATCIRWKYLPNQFKIYD
jgi:hypothetical protein